MIKRTSKPSMPRLLKRQTPEWAIFLVLYLVLTSTFIVITTMALALFIRPEWTKEAMSALVLQGSIIGVIVSTLFLGYLVLINNPKTSIYFWWLLGRADRWFSYAKFLNQRNRIRAKKNKPFLQGPEWFHQKVNELGAQITVFKTKHASSYVPGNIIPGSEDIRLSRMLIENYYLPEDVYNRLTTCLDDYDQVNMFIEQRDRFTPARYGAMLCSPHESVRITAAEYLPLRKFSFEELEELGRLVFNDETFTFDGVNTGNDYLARMIISMLGLKI